MREELLKLLKEDETFRLAVIGLLGITDLRSSMKNLIDAVKTVAENQAVILDLMKQVLKTIKTLYEDHVKLLQEVKSIREDQVKLLQELVFLREVQVKLWQEIISLHEGQEKLSRKLDSLGARWGVFSESAFRLGIGAFLERFGYRVERWDYYDGEGYVYGYPSQVDLDVIVRNEKLAVAEIRSSVSRGDLSVFRRKVELYEKVTGRKVDARYIITYYIGDRKPRELRRIARSLGIRIIEPEKLVRR
ncbi:MAG: DUF3782 domain-containing protein [Sulfolobales archaeon]